MRTALLFILFFFFVKRRILNACCFDKKAGGKREREREPKKKREMKEFRCAVDQIFKSGRQDTHTHITSGKTDAKRKQKLLINNSSTTHTYTQLHRR